MHFSARSQVSRRSSTAIVFRRGQPRPAGSSRRRVEPSHLAYDAVGFFLSGHPLDDHATVLKRLRVQSWAEFSRAVKTGVRLVVCNLNLLSAKTRFETGLFGGVMFGREMIVLLAAALLSGCVSDRTGFDYAAVVQKLGPPKSGQSRIVLISEKASGLDTAVCDVKIDGGAESRLRPGTYVYVDRPAGRHEIVATQTLFPGETRRDVATQSERTYFFLARNSERSRAIIGVTMFGGLAGAVVASAVTSGSQNPGPVDLFPLEEAAARTTLAELARGITPEPRGMISLSHQ